MAWSGWQTLPVTFKPEILTELLDGGQSFRWNQQADATWLGTWAGCVARLKLTADGQLQWSAPNRLQATVARELPGYLGLDSRHTEEVDRLPWRSDPHLATCLAAFPGLRILRQPFGETLLCFLCSATKQIVQIKQMTALLAQRHGQPLAEGLHRLPSWPALAGVSESELRECLLGFRARHIHQTALFLAGNPGWLDETEKAPYALARQRLCSLPGVGEKVADCVLLFGAGRLESFPVDVWILRTMARRYGLDGWRPEHVAQFGRAHFGAAAGLAQQYLFAYERRAGRSNAKGGTGTG